VNNVSLSIFLKNHYLPSFSPELSLLGIITTCPQGIKWNACTRKPQTGSLTWALHKRHHKTWPGYQSVCPQPDSPRAARQPGVSGCHVCSSTKFQLSVHLNTDFFFLFLRQGLALLPRLWTPWFKQAAYLSLLTSWIHGMSHCPWFLYYWEFWSWFSLFQHCLNLNIVFPVIQPHHSWFLPLLSDAWDKRI
jgi:hypothetical protein